MGEPSDKTRAPTPRTDAFARQMDQKHDPIVAYQSAGVAEINDWIDLARQLERELAEARATIQRQLRYAEAVAQAVDADCETCKGDPNVCANVPGLRHCEKANRETATALSAATRTEIVDIVFDGPPSHDNPRFVEVESPPGASIKFGEWVHREDGYWAIRFTRSATLRTVKAVPFDDILSQIDHIQENGMNVAKFGGQDVDEGRCRQLCAMYLREFITSEDMRQRLIELDQRFEHEAQERCIAVYKDYSRDEIKAQPVSVQRVWMMGENASLNSVDGTAT